MIIGDITYYAPKYSRKQLKRGEEQRLVRTSDFDSGVGCPRHSAYPDHLSIWRATNGRGFCAIAGNKVANYALNRGMTLSEFCARYSDMDATTIAAIKAQYTEI